MCVYNVIHVWFRRCGRPGTSPETSGTKLSRTHSEHYEGRSKVKYWIVSYETRQKPAIIGHVTPDIRGFWAHVRTYRMRVHPGTPRPPEPNPR